MVLRQDAVRCERSMDGPLKRQIYTSRCNVRQTAKCELQNKGVAYNWRQHPTVTYTVMCYKITTSRSLCRQLLINVTSNLVHQYQSSSWLAWANGTTVHYVVIHCLHWTTGPTVQQADIPSPQSATLGPHPVAHNRQATTHSPSHTWKPSWPYNKNLTAF